MKSRITSLFICICLSLGLVSLAQADSGLEAAVSALTKGYSNSETLKMQKAVNLLKEADLSYQEILVTPFMTIGDCKSQADLGVMQGMYLFDSNYALVFGKQGEFLQARRAIMTETMPRLEVSPKLAMTPIPPEMLKDVAQNPYDMEKREALFTQVQKNFDELLKQGQNDPAVLGMILDTTYGTAVQGLFVSLSLAVGADMEQPVLDLMAAQASRVEKLSDVLGALIGTDAGKALFRLDRDEFLKYAKAMLTKNDGKPSPADLKALLARTALERGKFILQCQ